MTTIQKANAPGAVNTDGRTEEQQLLFDTLYHNDIALSIPKTYCFTKIPEALKVTNKHKGLIALYDLCAWVLTKPDSTAILASNSGMKAWLYNHLRKGTRFEPLQRELCRLYLKAVRIPYETDRFSLTYTLLSAPDDTIPPISDFTAKEGQKFMESYTPWTPPTRFTMIPAKLLLDRRLSVAEKITTSNRGWKENDGFK